MRQTKRGCFRGNVTDKGDNILAGGIASFRIDLLGRSRLAGDGKPAHARKRCSAAFADNFGKRRADELRSFRRDNLAHDLGLYGKDLLAIACPEST